MTRHRTQYGRLPGCTARGWSCASTFDRCNTCHPGIVRPVAPEPLNDAPEPLDDAPGRSERSDRPAAPDRVVEIAHHAQAKVCREVERDGPADTARRAGDQGDGGGFGHVVTTREKPVTGGNVGG